MRHDKTLLLALAVMASLVIGSIPAVADGNVNFILGGRGLDEDFWAPNESMSAFGVNIDFGPDDWPVRIAIGLSGSTAENDTEECRICGGLEVRVLERPELAVRNVKSSVGELSAGVLYRPRGERKLIPFVGGGLAFMTAEQEIERFFGGSATDDDTTVGVYVNGGVYWRIGKRFNIGFDGRVVTGTSIQLFDKKGDANYGQLGLILGWGW